MSSDDAFIDEQCDAFEREWQAGREPDLVSFMAGALVQLRPTLAHQLVAVDSKYRRKRFGTVPALEEYAEQLQMDVRDLFAAPETVVGEDTTDAGADGRLTKTLVPRSDEFGEADFESGTIISDVDPDFVDDKPFPVGETRFQLRGYEILGELGRGGMGVVYKARQLKPSRLVALKTIHAPAMASSQHVQRFQAEAEAAGRLDHRGIVPVFEVGEQDGVHFFSMGFVDGVDLENRVRKQVLPCVDAATLAQQVADALEYAHQSGVIHRDIKPHNILIDADGNARITDFGLAKLAESDIDLTGSGQVMGTAAYMPPEQATGRTAEAGPTADVYALGATLYRCITGRPPFQAASAMEIMRQVVDDEPLAPRRLNKEVDEDIQTLCLKCMEKSPERRFQTAGDLAAELTRYLNGEPILSRPVGPVTRLCRWGRRRPYVAMSSLLALCLFLAVSTGIPLLLLQQQRITSTESDKQQAEQLAAANRVVADTEKFYATVMKVRELRMEEEPPLGWTWSAQDMLQQASRSLAPNKDRVELRTLMTEMLLTPDMRPLARSELGRDAQSLAISADGHWLAVGDHLGTPFCDAHVFQLSRQPPENSELPMSLSLRKTCRINTAAAKLKNTLFNLGLSDNATRAESMSAVALSDDNSRLAVATRNAKLIVWDINNIDPRQLLECQVNLGEPRKIEFSADGQSVYAYHKGVDDSNTHFRRVDLKTGDQTDAMVLGDFHRLTDNRFLMCRHGSLYLGNGVVPAPTTELQASDTSAFYNRLTVDVSARVAASDPGNQPTLLEPFTGRSGIAFEQPSSLFRTTKISVAGGSSLLIFANHESMIRLWDAVSGDLLRTLKFNATGPLFAVDQVRHRIYICSEKELTAYELRAPLTQEPAEGISHCPVRIFAPGVRRIDDFDVSEDGTRLALIERDEEGPRVFQVLAETGDIERQWRFWNVDDQPPGCAATTGGACVTHLGTDQLAVSGFVPGNILTLSDNGLEPVTGLGIDAVTAGEARLMAKSVQDSSATSRKVIWEAVDSANTNPHESFRIAVTIRIPRRLKIAQEKLQLRILDLTGDHRIVLKEVTVNETDVDDVGSYTLFLGTYSPDSLPEKWGVEAEVLETEDLFFQTDTDFDPANTSAVRPGKLVLFPIVSDEESVVTVRHLAGTADGRLAAIIGPNAIRQWVGQPLTLVGQGWKDLFNSWRDDIQDLAAADNGCFTGSESGLTVRIQPDGQFQVLRKQYVQPESQSVAITAVAVSADGTHAAAGTFAGELQVYRPRLESDALVARTEAHQTAIKSVAISNDGTLLASADDAGAIHLWANGQPKPQLLFSLPVSKHRCVRLEFSPDGRFLYFLRTAERGVRRLDLQRLREQFSNSGIGW